MAEAFIPNPDELPEVNHKDENRNNNCVDNLEWCDKTYNNNYGNHTTRFCKLVLCVETKIIYSSSHEASRQTGVNRGNICNVCRNHKYNKTAGGYHWKYVQ